MRRLTRSIVVLLLLVVLQAVAWVRPPTPLLSQSRSRIAGRSRIRPRCASLRAAGESHTKETNVVDDVKLDLKLLLLDHYDSFTYNLADMLAQICVRPPVVLAADCADSWEDLLQNHEFLKDLDGIILSPGPGNPVSEGNLTMDIVRHCADTPILGVCLGHQILGHVYGATVDTAPVPIHGQVWPIQLVQPSAGNDPLWRNMPDELPVTRYHSLAVQLATITDAQPRQLQPTAISVEDNVLMAMKHVDYPHFGVQFHPESIGTVHGKQLLQNFCQICDKHQRDSEPTVKSKASPVDELATTAPALVVAASTAPFTVYIHKVTQTDMLPDTVMQSFLSHERYAFWLDEALSDGQTAAVSILGASNQRVEYWGQEKPASSRGLFQWNATGQVSKNTSLDILTYLHEQHCHATDAVTLVDFDNAGSAQLNELPEDDLQDVLPFDYRGGHVGYLGYEVRHDTSRYLEEQEYGHHHEGPDAKLPLANASNNPKIPTAAFLCADRSFVYDHQGENWYLVGVVPVGESPGGTLEWLQSTAESMRAWNGINSTNRGDDVHTHHVVTDASLQVPVFTPNRARETYNTNFDECLEQIRLGESYELCLTNHLETTVAVPGSSPLGLYNVLRRRNPAPFSAFMNWNGDESAATTETQSALALCCSSPERFVSVKRKEKHVKRTTNSNASYNLQVEAKPIKGTCARVIPADGKVRTTAEQFEDAERAQLLQSSIKNRAENLMIVDLLRNDISRVCKTGSVHVAKLMDIESYATVHQMVSTIRGTLDPSKACAIDVLKACFPGGSMTGAPKLRTMDLLNAMEEGVSRGPYSGCLGYISLNGSMDMNIVIRTAILTPASETDAWNVSIGAGGAITALSESTDEYEEMELKASAVVRAVQEWACIKPVSTSGSAAKTTTTHVGKAMLEGALLDSKTL